MKSKSNHCSLIDVQRLIVWQLLLSTWIAKRPIHFFGSFMLCYTCAIAKLHQIELKLEVRLLSTMANRQQEIEKNKLKMLTNMVKKWSVLCKECKSYTEEANCCVKTKHNISPNGAELGNDNMLWTWRNGLGHFYIRQHLLYPVCFCHWYFFRLSVNTIISVSNTVP